MAILDVHDLEQSYGGLDILKGISFSLEPGERKAIIGPNGAGKTTLFNVLSGLVPSNAGRIQFLGKDITHASPETRAAMGLSRSFQITNLFPKLSVVSNILLAIQGVQKARYEMFRPVADYKDNLSQTRVLLEMVDLWGKRNVQVCELSHGQQRQIEIILALAAKPKLLLLDEPNAGLTRTESDRVIDLINSLIGDTTVILSAHDMDLVFTFSKQIMVLYYGKILMEGTPDQIQSAVEVREIYLGAEGPEDA
jgi:branched-chain amino acid transport system ATP-binding protein